MQLQESGKFGTLGVDRMTNGFGLRDLNRNPYRHLTTSMVDLMHENTSAFLETVQRHAAAWFSALASRKVRATLTTDELRQQLGGPLPGGVGLSTADNRPKHSSRRMLRSLDCPANAVCRTDRDPFAPTIIRGMPKMSILLWAGSDSHFDEPLFDIGADHIRVIFLQVVNARAKLHHPAVLKPLREALSEGRRHQSAWITREK